MKCKDCFYFKPDKDFPSKHGKCFIDPPVMAKGNFIRPHVHAFDFCHKKQPVVKYNDWCKYFEKKTEEIDPFEIPGD